MWRDVRCLGPFRRPGGSGRCGQLLLRLGEGVIEIKCPRCHHIRLLRWQDRDEPVGVSETGEKGAVWP